MGKIENIKEVKTSELIPYINNAKIHSDEQVSKIASSIREFGFISPVLIDNEKNIIAGHGRVMAAQKLQLEEVPCVFIEGLTEAQRKAFILAENRLGELADWDMELVNSELQQLLDLEFDIELTGFDLSSSIIDTAEADEDDYEEELPEEPKTKLGDMYQLGDHILLCGDSTNEEDVKKLIDNGAADLVITDPPYNVDYTGKTKKELKIENDNMTNQEFLRFLESSFKNLERSLKQGGVFYVWYAIREHINFETALKNAGLEVRQQIIWNKNHFIMGRQDYQWKHEPCLYGWKEGASHYFIDDRTQTTVYEDAQINIKKMKKEEMAELLEQLLSDKISSTIINETRPTANDLHPTMKPIKLLSRQIKNSSKPGEIVLDLFGGSGSTLMACEQLNRKARLMEYDPKYADVIVDRWEKFTGKKAVLLNEQ